MHGTPYFKPVGGGYWQIGYLTTASLALSDGDANNGIIKTGKCVNFAANSQVNMAYAAYNTSFLGFLSQDISANGFQVTSTYEQFQNKWLYNPVRRGLACSVLVPHLFSMWEMEGLGTVGINTMVVTSGTGAVAANTALNTELTLESGAWRKAASGERVYAELTQANLAPAIVGNIRIQVKILSPYFKA